MIISVSPAATVVVFSVPLTHVAVGSASGFAAGATHLELGIAITSPTLMRRGLVICGLTSRTWSSVTLAAVAMLASPSPAMTVWLETMSQFVPIAAVLFAASVFGSGMPVARLGAAEVLGVLIFAAKAEAAAASRRNE